MPHPRETGAAPCLAPAHRVVPVRPGDSLSRASFLSGEQKSPALRPGSVRVMLGASVKLASQPELGCHPRQPPQFSFVNPVTCHDKAHDPVGKQLIEGRFLVSGVGTTSALKRHGGTPKKAPKDVLQKRARRKAGLCYL